MLDSTDIGKLRPQWDGPFSLLACPPTPSRCRVACAAALPPRTRRQLSSSSTSCLPSCSLSATEGWKAIDVDCREHTSADDEWLREEGLVNCRDKVAENDAAAPVAVRAAGTRTAALLPLTRCRRSLPRRRRRRSAATARSCYVTSCRPAVGGRSGLLGAAGSGQHWQPEDLPTLPGPRPGSWVSY